MHHKDERISLDSSTLDHPIDLPFSWGSVVGVQRLVCRHPSKEVRGKLVWYKKSRTMYERLILRVLSFRCTPTKSKLDTCCCSALLILPQHNNTMTRSGLAKGKNKGHITQERELKPKPSQRKGVRLSEEKQCGGAVPQTALVVLRTK
jgi:hypothetical protein